MSTAIDNLKEAIEFEIGEIESLFQLYQKELFDLDLEQTPDLLELTAFASVLHSFYNGIENILLGIAKNIDKKSPSDLNWHKILLAINLEEKFSRFSEHGSPHLFFRTKCRFHLLM